MCFAVEQVEIGHCDKQLLFWGAWLRNNHRTQEPCATIFLIDGPPLWAAKMTFLPVPARSCLLTLILHIELSETAP